jgi:hypothetical protein
LLITLQRTAPRSVGTISGGCPGSCVLAGSPVDENMAPKFLRGLEQPRLRACALDRREGIEGQRDADKAQIPVGPGQFLGSPCGIGRGHRGNSKESSWIFPQDRSKVVVERSIEGAQLLDRKRRVVAQRHRVAQQLALDPIFIEMSHAGLDVGS